MSGESKQKEFQNGLDRLGILVDALTAGRLAVYHEMLVEWNSRMNLTGDASLETMLDRHYLDSLAPLQFTDLFPENASLIDVGSGAGLPGLLLAIARPDMKVLLLDSLAKRLKFLDAVIETLELTNVQTLHARAEDAAHNPAYRERFTVATARAVAAAPVLMELLLPFVQIGGCALCYKGPSAAEEQEAAARAARLLGGSIPQLRPVALPGHPDWQHCLVVSRKHGPANKLYPRKAGTPAKMPLGIE